jgi:predicted permease
MVASLRSFLGRLRALFIGRRLDDEFDREVESHLTLLTEENIRQGMAPDDACRAALRAFGGVTQAKEHNREHRGLRQAEICLQDLRYAWRILRSRPGFTVVAVLTLALGIGANTAMFSVVNAVMWQELPYQSPERIAYFLVGDLAHGGFDDDISIADFVDWKRQNRVFDEMATFRGAHHLTLAADGVEPERIAGNLITANLLPVLGWNVWIGRNFLPEEEQPGHDNVVILSHQCWRRTFSADPNILGKKITLDGRPYAVVGVLPAGLRLWGRDVYVPFALSTFSADRGTLQYAHAVARLKPGVTMAQAQTEMANVAREIELDNPATNQYRSVKLRTLLENETDWGPTRRRMRQTLLVMLGAAGLVTLMACVNVASLLLARGLKRQKEFVMRIALGSSRARIARQLLTETLLLFLCGGAAGLVLAVTARHLMVKTTASYLNGATVDGGTTIALNPRIFLFSFVVSLIAGALFGLAPALQAVRVNLNDALNDVVKDSGGWRRNRLRSTLISMEISLAMVMLVGFGLLARSFIKVMEAPQGFEPANVLTIFAGLNQEKYATPARRLEFSRKLLDEIYQMPGVRTAGIASAIPLMGGSEITFFIEGRDGARQTQATVRKLEVSPGYFSTFGIPLRQGRLFNDHDDETAPTVALVNETLARRYFPDESPLGKRVKIEGTRNPWCEIVGVVADAHQRNMDEDEAPLFFRPWHQAPQTDLTAVAKINAAAGLPAAGAALRTKLHTLDKDQAWERVQTMEEVIDDSESVVLRRPIVVLLGTLGTIALLLAVVGIYGVLSYSVTERTHEIGIRMALGALPGNVVKVILRETLILLSIGLGTGLAMALALTRLLPTGAIGWSGAAIHLYGVTRTDAITYSGVILILSLVALLASYIPARRAARIDPMRALRYE